MHAQAEMVQRCSGSAIVVFLALFYFASANHCGSGYVECRNGNCVPGSKVCDGINDCIDGEDENRCHNRECAPPLWFRCPNGHCINSIHLCDGERNCADGSDERVNCGTESNALAEEGGVTCSRDEFMCTLDKTCIKRSWMCDGDPDCIDGSDETVNCLSMINCTDGFRCRNGLCIIKEFHCDGFDDCGDNSDEESCLTIFRSVDNCHSDQGYFLCADKVACIDEKEVCDGFFHCFDKSDELDCLPKQNLNQSYCRSLGCSHSCHLFPHNQINCTCNTGYKLAVDEKTCIDIDECLSFGFCHQRCKNLNGSYECFCDNGYILQPDGKTCKASGGDALLLFSSYNKIRGIYLQSEVYFTVAKDLSHVIGVSHSGHHVYWTDISHGEVSIVRATESGSNVEILVDSGLGIPEDLAVDYVTNNIYFTDRIKKHIGVCSESGVSCTVLNNEDIDKPRAIALYPQKGILYWSDWGETALIATSGMDGSDPRALVFRDLGWPNGLTLDINNDRLYWVDAKALTIETVRLDGSDRQIILSKAVKHPFSVAIFEDMLYWSDWENKEIQKCNKFTGKNHSSVVKERKKNNLIYGVHIYHPVLQPRIENPCRNTRCSHICLLTPNISYSCACPEHYSLGPDLHMCRVRSKPLQVVVGGDRKLLLLSPQHLGRQSTTEINLPDVNTIGCMAYDSLSDSIIISDSVRRKLFRFNLNTKAVSILINSGLGHVSSMSFDYYGNNLYITDSELKRVDVRSMTTGSLVTIYKTYHGDIPESIIVIPEHGVFFLAISRANGSISLCRVNMDGTEVLPHIGGNNIHGPKISLSYDRKTQRVYWSDSDAEIIESMRIDGTNREVILAMEGTPISIATQQGLIFWVKRKSSDLYMHNLNLAAAEYSEYPETVIKMAIDDEYYLSLTAIGESETAFHHTCQSKSISGCSHVCLVSFGNQRTCACPLGMHLGADNRTCAMPANCSDSQFKCRGDDLCIAKIQRCDGHSDCPSGDDEKDCDVDNCKENQFQCTNGQCIAASRRCDNEYDCSDRSDEYFCTSNCTQNNFQCGSGECIPEIWRCNFLSDCQDSSDEHGCEDKTCEPHTFKCKSGTCIPSSWECDNYVDCPDGTDEHEKCEKPTCKPDELRCASGRCISKTMECDGMDDCGDGTDESSCSNSEFELQCDFNEFLCKISKNKCVPQSSRCNGTAECPRGEDEMDCSNCRPQEFQCKNMKCIFNKWVCDKENDCIDGSDEDPLLCSRLVESSEAAEPHCNDFRCRTGECIPLYLVCDGKANCRDGSDEGENCERACISKPCQQICMPTPVAARCSCHDGFVLNSDGYSCNDVDECAEQRCSQLCSNTPGSFNCSCLPDYLLKSDKLTCKAVGPAMSYVLSGDDEVRRISHDFNHVDFLFYEPESQILGIDLDARRKLLYWSTGINHRINVMNIDGNEKRFILGAGYPGKLSLDWIANNIYYVDNADFASIKICNLAEKKFAEIVRIEKGFIISSLFFNPLNGILYYSKVHSSALTRPVSQIMQHSALFHNSTVLVDSNVSWVSGFAYDHVRQYLFWSDLYHQVVEKIRFDGKERQIVFKAEVQRPESLTFFEDSLYWLSKSSGTIKQCKLYGNHKGKCSTIPIYLHDIKFLEILQEARQPNVSNPCRNKCDESSLCVISPGDPQCMCEDGSVLEKGRTCDESQRILSNEIIARFSGESLRQYLSNDKPRLSGNSSAVIGILMTALVICTAFASYLYMKRRKSRIVLETMHFQNPSFGLSHIQSPYHPSELTPGEHQYENPTAKLVQHPDGKYGVLIREKEPVPKNNDKFNLENYESDSDQEDRMDMKANLIP